MLLCAASVFAQGTNDDPCLDFVMELRVKCSASVFVGKAQHGTRNVIPITGGTFKGPRIEGEVLPGGADYQLLGLTPDNLCQLEAIYNIRTNDGVNIQVHNLGITCDDNGRPYFYTTPRFEAPSSSRYSWLNNGIYVCRPGGGMKDGVVLHVWKVRDAFKVAEVPALPESVRQPAAQKGTVEDFAYRVKDEDGTIYTKHARVYLPHGYRAKGGEAYNVVYLMHGGGDNNNSFYADPRSPLPLTQVLDHLVAEGKIAPTIVVAPTYYNERPGGAKSNGMNGLIDLARNFHSELQNYLIPSVERQYNTYFRQAASARIKAKTSAERDSLAMVLTRDHRAFGGFSMGALSTWFQLAYGVDAVKYFIPLSGDLWLFDAQGQRLDAVHAAEWIDECLQASPFAGNFYVYGYTGTDDMAYRPQSDLVKALDAYARNFRYVTRPNLFFQTKTGGKHYYGDTNHYLYFALPRIFPKEGM